MSKLINWTKNDKGLYLEGSVETCGQKYTLVLECNDWTLIAQSVFDSCAIKCNTRQRAHNEVHGNIQSSIITNITELFCKVGRSIVKTRSLVEREAAARMICIDLDIEPTPETITKLLINIQ